MSDIKIKLQAATHSLKKNDAFIGNLLQELVIKYTNVVPTAGLSFNSDQKQFELYINPSFFNNLSHKERVAVFHHEVLHFLNKHLIRFNSLSLEKKEFKLMNVAADMAINQFISNLPKGAINYKDWKLDDGSIFPEKRSMEEYFELIKKELQKQKQNDKTLGNVEENVNKFKEFDVHDWDNLDEETRKKMLQESKSLLKRTVDKTVFTHDSVPNSIYDILKELTADLNDLDYKTILRNTIKKTVSAADRTNTWKKPNKRYGIYSPGNQIGNLPKLAFFNDSSGSISITEQNEYLRIMDEFLRVGVRSCLLSFWHTELYYKKPYKRGHKIETEDLQSGGTDVKCVLEDIKKNKYDLSIILTDGYFDKHNVDVRSEVIWIISKNGNIEHPMKHIGKTITLDSLKG